MKRDWDLLRAILQSIVDEDYSCLIDNIDNIELKYNLYLLVNGGFVFEEFDFDYRITFKGYELLDLMGDEKSWTEFKHYCQVRKIEVSYESLLFIRKRIWALDLVY